LRSRWAKSFRHRFPAAAARVTLIVNCLLAGPEPATTRAPSILGRKGGIERSDPRKARPRCSRQGRVGCCGVVAGPRPRTSVLVGLQAEIRKTPQNKAEAKNGSAPAKLLGRRSAPSEAFLAFGLPYELSGRHGATRRVSIILPGRFPGTIRQLLVMDGRGRSAPSTGPWTRDRLNIRSGCGLGGPARHGFVRDPFDPEAVACVSKANAWG